MHFSFFLFTALALAFTALAAGTRRGDFDLGPFAQFVEAVGHHLITGSKPAPLGGEQARPLAANAVRNAELGKALQDMLKTERAQAKIEYQPGFTPPPEPGKAAAGGAAPK